MSVIFKFVRFFGAQPMLSNFKFVGFFGARQRHGIRGDVRIEKVDTQPLKIVSDLAAPWFYSRAGTARLHCIK